jgi:DNA-binding CsgD family transcriptional regulator
MLQGHHLSVLEAQSTDELRNQAVTFAKSLGFRTITAFAVVDHSPTKSAFFGVDNTPIGFSEAYHDERLGKADPVMQHCKHKSLPIIWDQTTYARNNAYELWEHQASYGYKNGVALALHLPDGKHFSLGVDSDRPISSDSRQLTRIVAELQLFAVHAQETAFRILVPPAPVFTMRPELTPRELEVLKWTMDGRSASEIGKTLNIAERTVVFHLQNAMRKLNCTSKYLAVLKAIRLGILA